MSAATAAVLAELQAVREAKDARYGDTDPRAPADWASLLAEYVMDVVEHADSGRAPTEYRRHLVRVAALVVAAIETHDRRQLPDVPADE